MTGHGADQAGIRQVRQRGQEYRHRGALIESRGTKEVHVADGPPEFVSTGDASTIELLAEHFPLVRFGQSSGLSRCLDRTAGVASPWFGGLVGMEERDLVAVAERIGNERRRALEDELADGAVAGAEEIHAHVP